jgi:hypothetical protein
MLVLKYHLTEEEYLDYNYFTAWSSPGKRKYRFRYYMQVAGLYLAVAGLYIFANRSHNILIDLTIFGLIGSCYFLMVPYLIRRSIKVKVRSLLRKPENQHVLSQSEVRLQDTGIIDKDNFSESSYSWDSIVRKAETALCYYLYTNSYHAIVIPKRIVNGPEEQKKLNNFLDQYLPLGS